MLMESTSPYLTLHYIILHYICYRQGEVRPDRADPGGDRRDLHALGLEEDKHK